MSIPRPQRNSNTTSHPSRTPHQADSPALATGVHLRLWKFPLFAADFGSKTTQPIGVSKKMKGRGSERSSLDLSFLCGNKAVLGAHCILPLFHPAACNFSQIDLWPFQKGHEVLRISTNHRGRRSASTLLKDWKTITNS